MTAARRRMFILGVFGTLGLIAALFYFLPPDQPAARVRPPAQIRAAQQPLAEPEPALAAQPLSDAAIAQPAAVIEVPLPRPVTPPANLRPLAEAPQRTGPVDKRDNPGPNAARQMEILSYGFETLEEDVQACLEQWEASAPGEAAKVMIAFEIDAKGLQRSWLEHETEVPFGPRTCLANAVYGLDWSNIVDQPAKLTQRYELGARDGGKD